MGLHFSEQGSHIKKAEVIRKKEISKQLGINEEQKEEQIIETPTVEDDLKTKIMRKIGQLKTLDPIPDVEWWDNYLLPEEKTNFNASNSTRVDIESLSRPLNIEDFKVSEEQFNSKKITHYIQHPIPLKNQDFEKVKAMTVPIMLTDKERKRLKKLKRAERVKERHEKISLGLMPAPEPRLRMSSFMRAVTAQAVADPSRVEKEVRRQEIERQKAHIEHNENRRLTKQQRADKFKSKMDRDARKETWAALFKIKSLKDPKNYFKIDKNAQQLYLNGICLYSEKMKEEGGHHHIPNMIVVEGGKVAVRKYKKLLLRRIKWDGKADDNNDESSSSEDEDNQEEHKKHELKSTDNCSLVWEGTLQKRFFDNWKVIEIKSEHEALRSLSDRSCDHYWTMVINFKNE